jgi:hypothetical protein
MNTPRYGKPNVAYVSTWFSDPIDKPMWALNLMKYRPIADYQDGRDLHISGADADMLYNPTGPLAEVGGRVMLATDVLHQISGDEITWDRVAVAYYPKRMAMMEMQQLPSFIDLHAHKDAAMEFTIVMASMPTNNCPQPADWSRLTESDLLLVQVSNENNTHDLASLVTSRRIGEYEVEGVIVGDERSWTHATWDIISRNDVDNLVTASTSLANPSLYAMILEPLLDMMP